ncbi:MAG: hypothetical protein Q8K96_02330 [Rubrivivax sp.]|nr:hypothetical protein [Rubrivivax sp.]
MNPTSTDLEPARKPPATEDEAAAYLLALALGDPAMTPTKALDLQRQRVAALRDPTSARSLEVLARQLPVLESLWQRFSVEALRAKGFGNKAQMLRAALQAQQAHARTFALLRGMALQAKGQGVVSLEDDADADDSPDTFNLDADRP